MNSNIDEKEAELRYNYRFARALLNKLYFNINDLKTWQELFDLVKKNPEIDDDFWWELCKLDFTKIKYFPIKSLLAGMLNLKKDNPNISKIFDYIYFENTVYLEKYEERVKNNRIPTFIIYMAGMFGVAFFNTVNFLLLFYAPLNFKEILFNLIVGCYLSGLVYEIIERQDLFKWEIPYFENSKFLVYKWAYIPIIIFYLYMNILLLYTQGAYYNIEYKYKIEGVRIIRTFYFAIYYSILIPFDKSKIGIAIANTMNATNREIKTIIKGCKYCKILSTE